nr:E3 ubiquitin-protein ligase SINAT2 [Tanacetum cinerariifolium]
MGLDLNKRLRSWCSACCAYMGMTRRLTLKIMAKPLELSYECPHSGSKCSVIGNISELIKHLEDDHNVRETRFHTQPHDGCEFIHNHNHNQSRSGDLQNPPGMFAAPLDLLQPCTRVPLDLLESCSRVPLFFSSLVFRFYLIFFSLASGFHFIFVHSQASLGSLPGSDPEVQNLYQVEKQHVRIEVNTVGAIEELVDQVIHMHKSWKPLHSEKVLKKARDTMLLLVQDKVLVKPPAQVPLGDLQNPPGMFAVLNCYGQRFCYHFELFLFGTAPCYIVFLWFMGEDTEAKKFRYSFKVSKNGRDLTWQGVPSSIRDNHHKVCDIQDGLVIPHNLALLFLDENQVEPGSKIEQDDSGAAAPLDLLQPCTRVPLDLLESCSRVPLFFSSLVFRFYLIFFSLASGFHFIFVHSQASLGSLPGSDPEVQNLYQVEKQHVRIEVNTVGAIEELVDQVIHMHKSWKPLHSEKVLKKARDTMLLLVQDKVLVKPPAQVPLGACCS